MFPNQLLVISYQEHINILPWTMCDEVHSFFYHVWRVWCEMMQSEPHIEVAQESQTEVNNLLCYFNWCLIWYDFSQEQAKKICLKQFPLHTPPPALSITPPLTPISCRFLRSCSPSESDLFYLDSVEECGFQCAPHLAHMCSASDSSKVARFHRGWWKAVTDVRNHTS